MSFVLPLPTMDIVALLWFLILTAGYRLATRLHPLRDRGIMGAMLVHRTNWMLTMAKRDNRLMDAILLGNLSQGNAFFASTAAISIGGLVTVLVSGDRARQFFQNIPLAAETSPLVWEFKVIVLLTIFVYAFFKFAWAFRLTHYLAIMIGSTPLPDADTSAQCEAHARRAGQLNAIMGEHSASGLSAFYYAIAALAWFFHPVLFMIATAWVILVLMRRDFFSRSRAAISGDD